MIACGLVHAGKPLAAQPCHDPAFNHLNRRLRFGFAIGCRARRQDRRADGGCAVERRVVAARLVAARIGDHGCGFPVILGIVTADSARP